MYDATKVAERINAALKKAGKQQKTMLEQCDLSKNAISSMLSRGSMLKADNLAHIADYLGCSVDYLLGRTDDATTQNAIELAPEEYPVIVKYRGITEQGRAAVDKLLDELHKQKDAPTAYSDERIETILQTRPELTQLAEQIRSLDRDQVLKAIDYIQYLCSQQDKN